MKNTADSGVVVSDEAVLSILREAAERLILPRYQNLADTEVKTKTSATDFVTIADREAEAFIAHFTVFIARVCLYWRGKRGRGENSHQCR